MAWKSKSSAQRISEGKRGTMRRCCGGLMTVFRFIQFILSLVALGCGAYITYEMFDLSNSASQIQDTIHQLATNETGRHQIEQLLDNALTDTDIQETAATLEEIFTPILKILEGVPVRSIILTGASLWSIGVIVYMHFAFKSENSPRLNKRSVRVSLELLTFILWIASIVSASMLALEYSGILFTGGVEIKTAFTVLKEAIEKALKQLFGDGNIAQSLNIVSDIFNIGALAILAVISTSVCGAVSLISLIMSCCISGKPSRKMTRAERPGSDADQYLMPEKKTGFSVSEVASPMPSWQQTPVTPYMDEHASPRLYDGPQATPSYHDRTASPPLRGQSAMPMHAHRSSPSLDHTSATAYRPHITSSYNGHRYNAVADMDV